MKKKLLILLTIFLLSFNILSHASYDINSKLEITYENFILKLWQKYNLENQKIYLARLSLKIEKALEKNTLSTSNRKIINDLNRLLNETLYNFYLKEISFNEKQKILEILYVKKLEKILGTSSLPDFIQDFISNNRKFIRVNDEYEFVDNNYIKRIIFSNYYPLDKDGYKLLKDKSGYIIHHKSSDTYLFVEKSEIIKKIPYSESSKYFKFYSSDKNNVFNELWSFFTYNNPSYSFIQDKYWFYIEYLFKDWIANSKYWIHKNNSWKYTFIMDYQKVELIDDEILFWIIEKEKFLENIKNDKKIILTNTNKYFLELKKITEELTIWLSEDEKIEKIYAWILENIEYTTDYPDDNYEIYSWILTYKNKNWVCDWYVKLMAYMLTFAWVRDVEVLRWKVIDAQDFPEVWHAWLKIWDLYYDPTFDDPIWWIDVRSYNKYKYYWLPRDLFYTNRYDLNYTPKEIESSSLKYRQSLISQNLYKLSDKYNSNNYLLLKDSSFRKKYSLSANETITIETLVEVLNTFEVNDYIFYEWWEKKHISKISHFTLTNDNVNIILAQLNYDLTSRYFFKWKNEDWSYKYLISNTITLN